MLTVQTKESRSVIMSLLTLLLFSMVIASNSAAPVKNESEIWVEKEYIEEEVWKDPDMVNLATCSKRLDDIEAEHRDPVMDIKNLPNIDGGQKMIISGIMDKQKLWPDCLVPVVLEEGMTNTEKKRLACAVKFFFEKTCIRFAKRKDGDHNYVFIRKTDTDCYSEELGMDGGEQVVNFEEGGSCWSHGTIIHELMHAIGFFHEQARNDRDDYIEIHWDDIAEGWHSQFKKAAERGIEQRLVGTYDYKSVMHYPRHLNSVPSMTALQSPIAENNQGMGNTKAPTAMDAFKINELYNCGNRDCSVSEWEVRSPCIFGKQVITRRILQEPVGNGTACPEQLHIVAKCDPQVVCPQPVVEELDAAATRILLIGGEDAGFSMEIYTPNDALGRHVLGKSLTTERKGHVSAVIGDQVITAGGVFSENHHYAVTSEIYNYKLHELTIGPQLLEAREWSGSAVLNGTLYICGGQEPRRIGASCELLDNEKQEWQSAPPMATPRAKFGMATLCGQMYAIGGETGLGEATNTVEKYDPSLEQWSPVANMNMARIGHSAAALGDHLYVCGPSRKRPLSSCERYSPKEDRWSPIAAMRYIREGLTLVPFQDRLFAIGGFWFTDGLRMDVESYSWKENKWEESPDTLIRRGYHTAVPI